MTSEAPADLTKFFIYCVKYVNSTSVKKLTQERQVSFLAWKLKRKFCITTKSRLNFHQYKIIIGAFDLWNLPFSGTGAEKKQTCIRLVFLPLSYPFVLFQEGSERWRENCEGFLLQWRSQGKTTFSFFVIFKEKRRSWNTNVAYNLLYFKNQLWQLEGK